MTVTGVEGETVTVGAVGLLQEEHNMPINTIGTSLYICFPLRQRTPKQ